MKTLFRHTKKFFVLLIGITLLLLGIILLVFPGPGLVVIILGLVVLASEFAWAHSVLEKVKGSYEKAKDKVKNKSTNNKIEE